MKAFCFALVALVAVLVLPHVSNAQTAFTQVNSGLTCPYAGTTAQPSLTNTALQCGPLGPRQMLGMNFTNPGNATCFIELFDLAAANVAPTTSLVTTIVAVGAGLNVNVLYGDFGVKFNTGISAYAATTAGGNTGCNAAQVGSIIYK